MLTLAQHRKVVHEAVRAFMEADATASLDRYLESLVANPLNRLPAYRDAPPPPRATALWRPPELPPIYFRMDPDLHVVEASPALVELLGLPSADRLLGDPWEALFPPADYRRFLEQLSVAAQIKAGFVLPVRYQTPAGRSLTLLIHVAPLKDAIEDVEAWFGYVEGVTGKVIKMDPPPAPSSHQIA